MGFRSIFLSTYTLMGIRTNLELPLCSLLHLTTMHPFHPLVLLQQTQELLLDALHLGLLAPVALGVRVRALDGRLDALRQLPGLFHLGRQLGWRTGRAIERGGVEGLDLPYGGLELGERGPDLTDLCEQEKEKKVMGVSWGKGVRWEGIGTNLLPEITGWLGHGVHLVRVVSLLRLRSDVTILPG